MFNNQKIKIASIMFTFINNCLYIFYHSLVKFFISWVIKSKEDHNYSHLQKYIDVDSHTLHRNPSAL